MEVSHPGYVPKSRENERVDDISAAKDGERTEGVDVDGSLYRFEHLIPKRCLLRLAKEERKAKVGQSIRLGMIAPKDVKAL